MITFPSLAMTTASSPDVRFAAALSAAFFFTTLPCPAQHDPARLHGFGPDKVWDIYTGAPEQAVLSGDVDGDGRDDLILFHRSEPGRTGQVEVMLSDGEQFLPPVQWVSPRPPSRQLIWSGCFWFWKANR